MLAGKIGYFRQSFDPRNLPGLVAYWPMSEDASLTNAQALDVSGNGFHLTSSGALSNPGRNGSGRLLAAQGGQWNPSSARLSRGSWNTTPQWDANATGWSVAFWLFTDLTNNTQGTSSTAAGINFSTIAAAGAESVRLGSGTPANGFAAISSRCYFTDNTFLNYASGVNITGGMTSLTPQGQWTHMAFVADPATRTYTMFVNGVARTPLTYTADKVLSSFSSGLPCFMQWPGTIDEVVVYNRAISASEVLRLAGVPLSASSPSTLHPECRSWISRVLSNGGAVSTTTASAVNNFCNAIDAAGIRDRFYRLNLFCGTGLAAALVPLYRGPSLGGTQFGNATDTNVSFVSGDYSEAAGLTANLNKYLRTGCTVSGMGLGTTLHHHQTYFGPITFNNRFSFGTTNTGACRLNAYALSETTWSMNYSGSTSADVFPTGSLFRRLILSRTASNLATVYANGASAGSSSTSTSPVADTNEIWVFRSSSTGTGGQSLGVGMRSYSLGDSMTGEQVAQFDAALASFFTAIGRPT